MGFWMFFFDNDHWRDLYVKNCSLKNQSEWDAVGHPNVPLGIFYTTIGIIYELVYIPFILAMLKKEFIKFSCYKFMVLIGIIDLFVVLCNAIITGVQCILGAHFCSNPTFFFFVGAIACSGFYGVTLTCVILAFNRFLEMCFPEVAKIVFGGKRVYIWVVIPIIYTLISGFHLPYIYNTKRYVYYTDPFVEIEGMENYYEFQQFQVSVIHNITVATLQLLFYSCLVVVLKVKTFMHQTTNISKMQKLMTLQAVCICAEMFFAPIIYTYLQFYSLPNFLEVIAQIGWISIHGDTPLIYLFFNASLRKAVFNMVINAPKNKALHTVYMVKNNPRNNQVYASPNELQPPRT